MIEFKNVSFQYAQGSSGGKIENIDLTIKNGEVVLICGESGCGKTTLLRMIAGFNTIEDGEIYFNDTKINNMDPSKRNIGMVFQNYAVFPNMTVRENIAFGLKERKVSKDVISREVDNMIKLMKLEEHADKKPQALSGGQQQRLCIARTIAVSPEIILMDEPTSALDPISTVKMEDLMEELKKNYTVIIVNHNMQQAGRIADKTAFFLNGEIIEYGNTEDIFYKPQDKRTEDYITGRFG